MELRNTIERMIFTDGSRETTNAYALADRILALPEIAEALRLRVIHEAAKLQALSPERVGEVIRSIPRCR